MARVKTKQVDITESISVGKGSQLLLIAGPCQIESRELCLTIAEHLKEVCSEFPVHLVFKASYDKANRTSISSPRGPGFELGLEILDEVRSSFDLPIISDIHLPSQAIPAAEILDVLQIPAFLCRQTDLLVAAGKTAKPVLLKKGQFMHPRDMKFSAKKVASFGNQQILFCERGTCFGYRDLVVDFRSFFMLQETGYPVIFDATHSVQQMGGEKGSSGGTRQYVKSLAKAATAAGIDGLFLECHPQPDRALSDSASMIPLAEIKDIVSEVCRIREAL